MMSKHIRRLTAVLTIFLALALAGSVYPWQDTDGGEGYEEDDDSYDEAYSYDEDESYYSYEDEQYDFSDGSDS